MFRQLTLTVIVLAMIVALWTAGQATGDEVADSTEATLRVSGFCSRVVTYGRSGQFWAHVNGRDTETR